MCWLGVQRPRAAINPSDDDQIVGFQVAAKHVDVFARERVQFVYCASWVVSKNASVDIHEVNRPLLSVEIGDVQAFLRSVGKAIQQIHHNLRREGTVCFKLS